MLPDRPVEVYHVGAALAEHRENHGVTFEQMAAVTPGADLMEFKKIEASPGLDVWFLDRHHKALQAAWELATPRPALTLALRMQWYATPADWALWHQVMETRPGVSWWWGTRTDLERAGAHCYACGKLIYAFNVVRGMTKPARRAVMTHRYAHVIVQESLAPDRNQEPEL
jgi:hypothetical protein